MLIDKHQFAKILINDCDGTHPAEYVKAKSLLSIASSLVAITERLDKMASNKKVNTDE